MQLPFYKSARRAYMHDSRLKRARQCELSQFLLVRHTRPSLSQENTRPGKKEKIDVMADMMQLQERMK